MSDEKKTYEFTYTTEPMPADQAELFFNMIVWLAELGSITIAGGYAEVEDGEDDEAEA